jgi:GNAT superfamily N-acetyltransferase
MKTFQEFIQEAREKPSHDEVFKTITKNWNRNQNRDPNKSKSHFNVQFRSAAEHGGKDHAYLGLIDQEEDRQGQGIGPRFVRAVSNTADKRGLPVSVKPVAPKKENQGRLEKFYANRGFVPNTTKEIAPHPMIRHPKG